MRVDELFVDPVPAARGQLLHVQLARRQHHLPKRAVDRVAIDVDVREVVVRADLLELPERVLQRAPVPKPNVLERRLIVRGIGRLDGRLRGERALGYPVEPVCLSRQLYVVGDVGPFPHQFVRLDDERVHVRADPAGREERDHRGQRGGDQPADARGRERADDRDDGAERKQAGHDEHAGQGDVRLGVSHSGKNRVVVEQAVEAAKVGLRRHREKHGRPGQRHAAHTRSVCAVPWTPTQQASAHEPEEHGEPARQDRESRQPAGDQFPRRQREEIKGDRPAEDRIR